MEKQVYPFKFTPIFSEKIWGGSYLKQHFDSAPAVKLGEAWLLSDVPGNETPIANGHLEGHMIQEVIKKYPEQLLGNGRGVDFSDRFPLLFKVIDANDDLSVQVHPGDDVAHVKHHSSGKTEMWYVVDYESDAALISGFTSEIDKDLLESSLQNGNILELLKKVPVKYGDCFFIPAGRVHAIGKGIQVVEIQQTSDVTYRVYDFDRVDEQGKGRELHIEDAIEVLNFKDCDSGLVEKHIQIQEYSNLITCSHFKTDLMELDAGQEFVVKTDDSWMALLSISGKCNVETYDSSDFLNLYEVLLVPAVYDEVKIKAGDDCRLLVIS